MRTLWGLLVLVVLLWVTVVTVQAGELGAGSPEAGVTGELFALSEVPPAVEAKEDARPAGNSETKPVPSATEAQQDETSAAPGESESLATAGTGPLWLQWLDTAVKGIASVLGIALLWLVQKIFGDYRERRAYAEAIAALEQGWSFAQEEFVVWAKRAKADGKLTKEEREDARQMAIDHALSVATGPAKQLLMMWGEDRLAALLGKITGKAKTPSVEVVVPPAPSGA